MKVEISEKKLLVAWLAFFWLTIIPLLIAAGVWVDILGDNILTDWMVFVFANATSYYAFRLVVKKMIIDKINQESQTKEA